ncbi:MAG TPA: glycosyltransferase family 4 protein [Ktedonobacteraceae bacterium]|nr:glycosyltransferase family 4 protein [Ktedonobacteraceae bacterium]
MTHILFVSSYYPPEVAPPAIRIYETALQLVKLGHQVTVLTTFPNFPTGIVPSEYRGKLVQREERDGISIVRVWSYIRPNRGFLRRIASQLSFGCLAAFLGGKAVGYPDVLIVESPPLFNAIAGRILAWRKGCPFIFTVADLWPEVAVKMGLLRNQWVIRMAEWLASSTYRSAGLVWAVTSGLKDLLVKSGLPSEKVFVLTNGVDCTKFRPISKVEARVELGWDERFTLLYAGGHGPSHNLMTVLAAAEQLLEYQDIRIVLAGDGSEKEDLIQAAQQRGLKNVAFLDAQPHMRIPLLLAACDACLALATKAILFQGVIPAKMYEAMASARPLILMVDGEARRIAVEEAQAAIYAEPEDSVALAEALLYLKNHSEEAARLGKRGRVFVEEHNDRCDLVEMLDTHIRELLKRDSHLTNVQDTPETLTPSALIKNSKKLVNK